MPALPLDFGRGVPILMIQLKSMVAPHGRGAVWGRNAMAGFKQGDLIANRYEVLKDLGRCGMGAVYKVLDRETTVTCALKTLLPQYSENRRAAQRFIQEINAIRQLDHPGIVHIYSAQRLDGLLYYTMEYINGTSLRSWMKKKGRFGIGSTYQILSLLCDALEHAHRYTVHRDVSPENIMITPDGNVKLLDFGLVKITSANNSFTRVGVSLGKIQYSAPEQRADAKNVDHRADLYSLGVMFYEMLGNQLPINGKPLRQLAPDLPVECDAFIEKAMALSRKRWLTIRKIGSRRLTSFARN
ncbi:MAG: serine/threonine-protein kinase [Candidatus Hydrogenedentes bacterium]|nr:serine/threonine-protein kinase [Candidatus Hydrogenedentota bacterium]